MKIEKDTPFFPRTRTAGSFIERINFGLTIRHDFAARAMQAIVSSISSEVEYERLRYLAGQEGMKVSEWIARDACKQADALIKELNKTESPAKEGEKQ